MDKNLGKTKNTLLACLPTSLRKHNIINNHRAAAYVFSRNQAGFRKGFPTSDLSVNLQTEAIASMNCCMAIFLDFERAFDKVWHFRLLYKLIQSDLSTPFVRLILSFLSNRTCRVHIDGELSKLFTPRVPQGSALSPLLYFIMAYDVPLPIFPTSAGVRSPTHCLLGTSQASRHMAAPNSRISWMHYRPGAPDGNPTPDLDQDTRTPGHRPHRCTTGSCSNTNGRMLKPLQDFVTNTNRRIFIKNHI